MLIKSVSIELIPQLKDNYSYVIKDNLSNDIIIIDPAESELILEKIKNKKLQLKAILLTHHHNDHTAGVSDILKFFSVPVYSPSKNILGTSFEVSDNDEIKTNFINFKVISTKGHTLDHIVFYNKDNGILFSGDTLFRLGCGRVFEGTFEDMHTSLKKLEKIDNETLVFCGHEYTLNNLAFLKSTFPEFNVLDEEEKEIKDQLKKTNSSIPFNLGKEKAINPFLSSKAIFYEKFKKTKNLNDFEMFSFIRKLKDNF